jgi:hypothetical protein
MMGAGTVATPVIAMPVLGGSWTSTGAEAVVSGRVVSAVDGEPLVGARIEIWNHTVRITATADGDGRYFATVGSSDAKLNYLVTHKGHTAQITQLRLTGTRQRRVARVRDESGITRAACELALSCSLGMVALSPDVVVL